MEKEGIRGTQADIRLSHGEFSSLARVSRTASGAARGHKAGVKTLRTDQRKYAMKAFWGRGAAGGLNFRVEKPATHDLGRYRIATSGNSKFFMELKVRRAGAFREPDVRCVHWEKKTDESSRDKGDDFEADDP